MIVLKIVNYQIKLEVKILSFNRSTTVLTLLFTLISVISKGQSYNPVADARAVIQPEKNVRFTVLSSTLIRMEWDSVAHFTNQASFVVVNRKLKAPFFTHAIKNGWLNIRTNAVLLEYKIGSGKFNKDNLKVTYTYTKESGNDVIWYPGLIQEQNLKGTYRTLDDYDGDTRNGKKIPLENGILARDGWTLIDDSHSFLLDNASFPWIDTTARHSAQDWYLLMYADNYKAALLDYASIGGKVPLPPRFAFGYWWSRYWRYSDNEFRNLISNFKRSNIPLDVLVIDMDWHQQGWTGWTWDKNLFPDPAKFLEWTNKEHLKTTLNLHPADGVGSHEAQYSSFAKAMQFDTTGKKPVPYVGSDKKFMQTLFDTILRPHEKQGVDFWWLDWQQWPNDKLISNLSNTWWLNYVFFTYKEKYGNTRPLLYHRWGGLGNHRYQIGFSGDAIISWKSLGYQPYFTSTASNVLYSYWSHDIGGHVIPKGFKGLDPELYTRWMQYGALSPIFRTHSTKNGLLNKEVWEFRGIYFDAIYDAIKLRYQLEPYIYSMARETYDSAIALCRPLYYDYPTHPNAYQFNDQYQFGDDMLVAAVAEPSVDGISTKRVWLPPGNQWYEWNTGTLLKGDQEIERKFSLDEYPLYIKAGAIVPMNVDSIRHLDDQPSTISLGVFPGALGKGKFYEDGGDNKNYDQQYSTTSYETSLDANDNIVLTIKPVKGSFPGMKTKRKYLIHFYGYTIPDAVSAGGRSLAYMPQGSNKSHWHYNGSQMSIEVFVSDVDALNGKKIVIHYKERDPFSDSINGVPGKLRYLYQATQDVKYKNARIVFPSRISQMTELNRDIEYYPEKYVQLIDEFNKDYPRIADIIKDTKGIDDESRQLFLRKLRL